MSFAQNAKKHTRGNDPIFEGREKVGIGDVIVEYPEGITINDFALLRDTQNDTDYVVFVFEEEAKAFCFGGSALTNLFKDTVEEDYGGNIDAAREAIAKDPLRVKLSEKRSKNGRNYTAYEILD